MSERDPTLDVLVERTNNFTRNFEEWRQEAKAERATTLNALTAIQATLNDIRLTNSKTESALLLIDERVSSLERVRESRLPEFIRLSDRFTDHLTAHPNLPEILGIRELATANAEDIEKLTDAVTALTAAVNQHFDGHDTRRLKREGRQELMRGMSDLLKLALGGGFVGIVMEILK